MRIGHVATSWNDGTSVCGLAYEREIELCGVSPGTLCSQGGMVKRLGGLLRRLRHGPETTDIGSIKHYSVGHDQRMFRIYGSLNVLRRKSLLANQHEPSLRLCILLQLLKSSLHRRWIDRHLLLSVCFLYAVEITL
jgi:hypothetical protein